MHYDLALCSKRTNVLGHVAAGSSAQTSAVVDMAGFQAVVFDVLLGTNTTGQTLGTLQVQGGNKSDGSDMANLVGASMTLADADTAVGVTIEVVKPNYRYLQLVLTRNSQAVEILGVIATQYHDRKAPEGDDATTWPQTIVAIEPQYSQTYYTTVSTTVYTGSSGGSVGTATGTTVVTTYRNAS